MPEKPLGMKAYGSIPHLPGSRLGPGDHHVTEGQARICLRQARDRHDTIIVQEKLDGTCVSVAKINGNCIPLGRAGYPAISSRFEQHHLFAQWVYAQIGHVAAVPGEDSEALALAESVLPSPPQFAAAGLEYVEPGHFIAHGTQDYQVWTKLGVCSCPAFTFGASRPCKHLKAALTGEHQVG